MTATINWSVNKMDCYSQQDGNTDVVFVVCWVCRGTQEVNGEIYAAQINDNTTDFYVDIIPDGQLIDVAPSL